MDDLGKDVGRGVDGPGCRSIPWALLGAALLVLVMATPALAADEPAAISQVKGKAYRMASAKVANVITRFADPAGDQLWLDGTPAADAPRWSDIKAVRVAPARMPSKLLQQMRSKYPPGAAGVLYGDAQVPDSRDRVVFVAVQMDGKLPASSLGQQVEIGFSGDAASPVQSGTQLQTWAGTERFTLAGLFSNGAYAAAATDVSERQPGLPLEADEYYNARSGALGFYSPRNATWYVVLPRAGDTAAITVSVRSSTGDGGVIDRLDLPGGGHFIDLRDPTAGYQPKGGRPLLTCRSLETFSGGSGAAEGLDPASNLIRYTAGVDPATDPAVARRLLAQAVEAAGPVPVALTAVGSEGDGSIVEGELAVVPAGNAVTLTFEAPAGRWSFALDELPLKTPAGESIVDHRTLTGPAGVQVGPGLDGHVAGDRSCLAPAGSAVDGAEATDPADESDGEAGVEDPTGSAEAAD